MWKVSFCTLSFRFWQCEKGFYDALRSLVLPGCRVDSLLFSSLRFACIPPQLQQTSGAMARPQLAALARRLRTSSSLLRSSTFGSSRHAAPAVAASQSWTSTSQEATAIVSPNREWLSRSYSTAMFAVRGMSILIFFSHECWQCQSISPD